MCMCVVCAYVNVWRVCGVYVYVCAYVNVCVCVCVWVSGWCLIAQGFKQNKRNGGAFGNCRKFLLRLCLLRRATEEI